MKHAKPFFAMAALSVAVFPLCVSAATIAGGIHFSGDVVVTTTALQGSVLSFDFLPSPNSAYTFTVDNGSGFFQGLSGFGDETNFSSATAPINTAINIPDAVTFSNTPDTFTMTWVYPGVDGVAGCSDVAAHAADGNTCSPTGTPYNLQDIAPNGQNSSATLVVAGYLVDGTTNNPATITFTAASTGKSFEQILHDQANGTADVITYGAQLETVVVPEAGTQFLMLGAGLILAGSMFRRRKTR
jgi:hypothetical protein